MAEPGMEPELEAERGPEAVTAEAVLRELRLFELRCEGEEVPDKLVELCLSHGLGPVALANELLAFVTSKDLDLQLTPEGLDAFEHEVLAKRGSRGRRGRDERRGLLHDIHSLQGLLDEEQEDELLDAYTTPSKGSHKRSNSTPETPQAKRAPPSRSPLGLFSPGSFSPSVTPSQKYSSRTGRGEAVAAIGVTVRAFGSPEQLLSQPYRFMFQKLLDVREALAERVEELGEVLRRHHGLEGFSSAVIPAQEPVTVLGTISCDGNGKLNPKSVLLVGDREHSGGAQVPLDLSELPEYSLFPGQVVALEGTNPTGRRMVVTKIYEGVPLPFHTPTEPMPEARRVLVACGPFTPSDGAAFEPLRDLLGVLSRERPDLCILFGPFLDAKHEQVESCQLLSPFSDVFRLCLRTIIEGTRSSGCRLVLVPSLRDVSHLPVYPQPPFAFPELPKEDRARVLLLPEPCTLDVDGVVFGLSSTDLLLHLGAEEICSSSGPSDRFSRILRHVLTQRSFYPLYPPPEGLPLHLEALSPKIPVFPKIPVLPPSFYPLFYPLYPPPEGLPLHLEALGAFAALPVTPDVLVTPSELRFFIKDVLGCVCINPGRLTKGQAGGTYGRLLLRRDGQRGQSHGQNHRQNHGRTRGQSHGRTRGQNHGRTRGRTRGQSHGQNDGQTQGHSRGRPPDQPLRGRPEQRPAEPRNGLGAEPERPLDPRNGPWISGTAPGSPERPLDPRNGPWIPGTASEPPLDPRNSSGISGIAPGSPEQLLDPRNRLGTAPGSLEQPRSSSGSLE
ncbi:LOW QUALITY PROTEIN: DNA polymerase alpha subunit B [Passerculus sandwichensis]